MQTDSEIDSVYYPSALHITPLPGQTNQGCSFPWFSVEWQDQISGHNLSVHKRGMWQRSRKRSLAQAQSTDYHAVAPLPSSIKMSCGLWQARSGEPNDVWMDFWILGCPPDTAEHILQYWSQRYAAGKLIDDLANIIMRYFDVQSHDAPSYRTCYKWMICNCEWCDCVVDHHAKRRREIELHGKSDRPW